MFSHGRFDRMRFSVLETQGDDVQFIGSATEAMRAMVGTGGNIHEMIFASASVDGAVMGAPGVRFSGTAGAIMREGVRGIVRIMGAIAMAAEIAARLSLSQDSAPDIRGAAWMKAKARLSADVYWRADAAEALGGEACIGVSALMPPMQMDEWFDAQVTTVHFSLRNALFDLAIPPGGTLVIDSGGYWVLLDGEEMIHAHSGDWLILSRNTYDVALEAMEGDTDALEADTRVLYTEKWL